MENITRIFGPVVTHFFAPKGISISEISRIQAENKQQNDKFWAMIADAVAGVYRKVIVFLGSGRSAERVTVAMLKPDQVDEYRNVAKRNAQISSLMHALKLYKSLQEKLQRLDLRLFVVEALPVAPTRPDAPKQGTVCGTDQFMEMANIDEMIANLDQAVLGQFDYAFWTRANELNSRAATLGKLLSEQGSFFREIIKAQPKGGDQVTQGGVIITSWEKSYSETETQEFGTLRESLQTEYNDLQRQLNGCRKQVKDAVRAYNLEQERQYQSAYGVYSLAASQHALETERIRSAAETLRQEAARELAALKVRVE